MAATIVLTSHAATIERSFKKEDEGGGNPTYDTSEFLQERDLLTVAELLRQAWAWINEQGKA